MGADLAGEAENDKFGSAVAMSADGSFVVVGAIGGAAQGSVRVYEFPFPVQVCILLFAVLFQWTIVFS